MGNLAADLRPVSVLLDHNDCLAWSNLGENVIAILHRDGQRAGIINPIESVLGIIRQLDGLVRPPATPWHRRRRVLLLRFIPARAGNSCYRRRCHPRTSVHPRAGGELRCLSRRRVMVFGSSPRGRGTPRRRNGTTRPRRFIPARAGNSTAGMLDAQQLTVHPRAGGELFGTVDHNPLSIGSSPRGRGTRRVRPGRRIVLRFIPARAGNSWRRPTLACRSTVHPRAGGELTPGPVIDREVIGSSPRGRGTQSAGRLQRDLRRFIPARAGNSSMRGIPSLSFSVHPRAGGELPSWNMLIQRKIFLVKELTRFKQTVFDVCLKFTCSIILKQLRRLCICGSGYELDKLHAVQIHGGTSIYATGIEVVTRIICSRPCDDGIALFDFVSDLFPNHLACASRIVAYVHSSANLQ